MRKSGFGAIVLRDVARRPVVETGASVPGYSGSAERLAERLFGRGPDAKKRFRSRVLRDVAWGPSTGHWGLSFLLSKRTHAAAPGSGAAIGRTIGDFLYRTFMPVTDSMITVIIMYATIPTRKAMKMVTMCGMASCIRTIRFSSSLS